MHRQVLLQSRTRPITPQASPPAWLDEDRLREGQAFYTRHQGYIQQVLGTSSLAASFAAKDGTPVLMQTSRLARDFSQRLQETAELIGALLTGFKSRDEFLKNNYVQAVELGRLHLDIASRTRAALRWNPRERVVMNQQTFTFVLYTFAWWPIEALLAKGVVDPVRDRKDLDAWFHYWSVLGYGMGVGEGLLPKTYAEAKIQVVELRQAQYVPAGEPRLEGLPILLGGHVRMLAERMTGKPAGGATNKVALEKLYPFAARVLANMILLSPGLAETLGLEKSEKAAAEQLVGFAKAGQAP